MPTNKKFKIELSLSDQVRLSKIDGDPSKIVNDIIHDFFKRGGCKEPRRKPASK